MTSPTDNSEYLYGRAAATRVLLSQSKDSIIRQALSDIAESYETMARRAEQFKASAKPTRLLVLIALGWLVDIADAAASL